ncbi:MAG: 30S ribosomal protein S5 [bacterium]
METKDIQKENQIPAQSNQSAGAPRDFKRNSRKPVAGRPARVKPEFDQKIISIRRVTRVVTGGRRFNFSVGIVIGDRKGHVGVGLGKANDTPLAIDKAVRDARKNMIFIKMDKRGSIAHEVDAKYSSSRVHIMKAPGKGILAGSSVRTVLEFAGVKEVSSKIFSRSKNKVNNARAAIKALSKLKK